MAKGEEPDNRDNRRRAGSGTLIGLVAALVLAGVAIWWLRNGAGETGPVAVRVPPSLSAEARAGREIFGETCAACHGETAGGTEAGPPLVHAIYRPGHHGDGAFLRAVTIGVVPHHWAFGPMPPQPDIARADVAKLVAFVRELQRANGIF